MNSRFLVIPILLVLLTHSQRGVSLEPGHPELAGYQFFESEYFLTKIWIIRDQSTTLLVEAEFVPAGSNVARLLGSGEFDRPEILRNSIYSEQVLYLTELPIKGWNHGEELDELLGQVKTRRPHDIRQQLLHRVVQIVGRDDFNAPKRNDYFNQADWYQFPISDDSKFIALILDARWRQFDSERTINNQYYLIDIRL